MSREERGLPGALSQLLYKVPGNTQCMKDSARDVVAMYCPIGRPWKLTEEPTAAFCQS